MASVAAMGTAATSNRDVSVLAPVLHWVDDGHPAHVVQFYGEDAFLLDELSRFIGTALGFGHPAIVIATPAHLKGLAQKLGMLGLDVAELSQQGRYVALDASETLAKIMLDGLPDEARFADVVGTAVAKASALATSHHHHVAAFGEMVALLWAEGKPEAAIRLEQLWNGLARSNSFSLCCAYPISSFHREEHGDMLFRICAEHSAVIPGESYTSLASQDERLRSIAHLQQRAQALETEVIARRKVEDQLRRTQAGLESLVKERTAALEQSTAALRQLTTRLLRSQDYERRRISRELHDSFGQYLIALQLNLAVLRQSSERNELWSESEELMERCISEIRGLSYFLHPPTMDAAGIASAARWYVDGFRARSGLKLTLHAPDDSVRLPESIELALFRMLQEALGNIQQHAGASAADIVIRRSDDQVVLEVKDNGHGMGHQMANRSSKTGLGLVSMHERARELGGTFHLESGSTGTLVKITIPVCPGCAFGGQDDA